MIISQTPVRISFLGGGTDYPDHYRLYGGETLTTSINHYTLITVNQLTKFADYRLRVHYSLVESVQTLDDIRHPSARECLRFMGIEEGVEIHYISNLPARTGLGSSSSATVGLLHALHAFKGEMVGREQLAQEAVHVEQNCIQERVGSQDQYICALGGFRHLHFCRDGSIRADTVILTKDREAALQERLLLLYTGIQRSAHDILDEQIRRTKNGEKRQVLGDLHSLVSRGVQVLAEGPLDEFGELLHAGWMLKRSISSKISDSRIDDLYERARKAGAIGGKLLGAGGGGFLLLYVDPARRQAVKDALLEMPEVPIGFDNSGTQVIFYRP